MAERVVVVGGNAAGMTVAGRARRLDPDLQITVLESSHFISYSICGVPYLIDGQVPDHRRLVRFTPETLLRERGIRAMTRVRAEEILVGKRKVLCSRMDDGGEFDLEYDRLVVATGYRPEVPDLEGLDLDRVITVSRLEDGLRIREELRRAGCRRVAVVGAGYVGLMTASAVRSLGFEVHLFEKGRRVYGQVDEDMAELLEHEIVRSGVGLHLKTPVRRLEGRHGVVRGLVCGATVFPADLVLVDVGVVPETTLAERSGVPLGTSAGILVDERGQTRVGGVYAAGNCAETRHRVSGRPICSSLGTTAARQGRVVGDNLAGRRSTFPGTLETSVEKVFSLGVARTGLTLRQALEAGFEARAVKVETRDRAAYDSRSSRVHVKLIFEARTGLLLGGQILGDGEAVRRIDTLAAALAAKMTPADLVQLDLAYAPPYGTLWDPLQVAAQAGVRRLEE